MSGAPDAQERELEDPIPDVDCPVRDPDTGETVTLTVRQFRFREVLEAQVEARPLIEELASLPDAVSPLDADDALGAHSDIWLRLIARATDRDPEWIGRLDGESCFALERAMWAVNAGFVIRPAVKAARPEIDLASRYLSAVSVIRSILREARAQGGTGAGADNGADAPARPPAV